MAATLSYLMASLEKAAFCIVMCLLIEFSCAPPAAALDGDKPVVIAPKSRNSANIFISGHSLTDKPLGAFLEAIAKSLGKSIAWNEQMYPGSPIGARTRNSENQRWLGQSRGRNKLGQSGRNVREELMTGAVIGGKRYDTLIITERHDAVAIVKWENTVRELRDFHERMVEVTPSAETFFFEPWLGLPNKNDPSDWTSYERAASSMWQCVSTRINVSLKAEGRSDRIRNLPVGIALVELLERAMAGKVPEVAGSDTKELVNRIFSDDVHLKPLGVYYVAALTYSFVYGQSPLGAWAPDGISKSLATYLQELAWELASSHSAAKKALSLRDCREMMRDRFCAHWDRFQPQNKQDDCARLFSSEIAKPNADQNPFYFDATTDAGYWFPAPSR